MKDLPKSFLGIFTLQLRVLDPIHPARIQYTKKYRNQSSNNDICIGTVLDVDRRQLDATSKVSLSLLGILNLQFYVVDPIFPIQAQYGSQENRNQGRHGRLRGPSPGKFRRGYVSKLAATIRRS